MKIITIAVEQWLKQSAKSFESTALEYLVTKEDSMVFLIPF